MLPVRPSSGGGSDWLATVTPATARRPGSPAGLHVTRPLSADCALLAAGLFRRVASALSGGKLRGFPFEFEFPGRPFLAGDNAMTCDDSPGWELARENLISVSFAGEMSAKASQGRGEGALDVVG